MCGIFAFIQKGQYTAVQLKILKEYFSRIKHRGPDHTSFTVLQKFGYSVFLGFHRLAIIDPTESSNPLLQDEGVYLICNGEIYNYRYLIKKYNLPVKTGSDCEVILQLYKHYPQLWPTILRELDGVFAFVLFDYNLGIIYSGRDRIGIRPLFMGTDTIGMAFASEGKAIPLNTAMPYVPGHLSIIDLSSKSWDVSTIPWTTCKAFFNTSYISSQKIIRELFTEAVRKRLVSDREIGFLVSGGLDSSLTASVAHRLLGKRITTFSIGLQGSPDLAAAADVARHLDSNHHEIIISTKDILEALPKVIYHIETYDTTTIRASIVMYLVSEYIRKHTDIKVIFSGEGADEVFGGYLYFHNAPNNTAFEHETHRLINDLYKYDVLRADRTTSAWGLEVRVPFLDADLVQFVANLDPEHKIPNNGRIEKAILRRAFDGYLPDNILYRQKEAFSDGVGYSSVSALKEYAGKNKVICREHLEGRAAPRTPEENLYYTLFRNEYADKTGLFTEYYWMPKWVETNDPSATVLSMHKNNIT